MTASEIRKMESGSELDSLVCQKLWPGQANSGWFSTDLDCAMTVVNAMKRKGFSCALWLTTESKPMAAFVRCTLPPLWERECELRRAALGESPAHAICLAALIALVNEENGEQ